MGVVISMRGHVLMVLPTILQVAKYELKYLAKVSNCAHMLKNGCATLCCKS